MYLFLVDQKDLSTIDFQAMSERVAPETDLVQCLSPGTLTNLAERLKPEIIVVDFDSLDHESSGFFRNLRVICPEAHILVLTNPDNYQNLHMIIEQGGIDEYVFKPFSLNDFLARVHIVSRRKAFPPEPLADERLIKADRSEKSIETPQEDLIEAPGEDIAEDYAEKAEDLFDDYKLETYEDKTGDLDNELDPEKFNQDSSQVSSNDFFDQPGEGAFDQEPAESREASDPVTDTTGLLLGEDLDKIIKSAPAEQDQFASQGEDDFQTLFADQPGRKPEKPAATDVDLFSDIIAGGEADYAPLDFPAGPKKSEASPSDKLDKLPEPFDSEFPDIDSHELSDLDLQLFSEPAIDQTPAASEYEHKEPGIGVPPPPNLSELKMIHGGLSGPEEPAPMQEETLFSPQQAHSAGQPAPPRVSAKEPTSNAFPQEPGDVFDPGDQEETSFDQLFTDRVDVRSQREEEPLATVDEFESFFTDDGHRDLNEFDLPEGKQMRPFFDPENDFSPRAQQNQSAGQASSKVIGTILNVFFALVLVFIAGIAFFLIQAQLSDDPPTLAGYEIYLYMNDSMKPEFAAGSLILVREIEAASIALGDVITFPGEVDPNTIKVSRVVGINRENGLSFVTRPDAASVNDPSPVSSAKVIGKVTNTVPYVGYLLDYAQTREGVIMLVFIPGLLIIVYQLVKIIRFFSARGKREAVY